MTHVLPFLVLLGIGQFCRHLPVFPEKTDRSLNLYVIYIALPALILKRVPGLHLTLAVWPPIVLPWLTVGLAALAVWLLTRLFSWDRQITGALLLMVPLGNTSFFGIPMVELAFGSSGVKYAVLYDQFGSFLALSTYGAVILALYGEGAQKRLQDILLKILLFPPFIALVVALFLDRGAYPGWLAQLLTMAASSLVPVVFTAIGFQMDIILAKDEILPTVAGLSLRLLGIPLVLLAAMHLLSVSGTAVRVALYETAMPPMVAAGALASIGGLKPRLCSALVGYGILVSFFTLPLIYRWSG